MCIPTIAGGYSARDTEFVISIQGLRPIVYRHKSMYHSGSLLVDSVVHAHGSNVIVFFALASHNVDRITNFACGGEWGII